MWLQRMRMLRRMFVWIIVVGKAVPRTFERIFATLLHIIVTIGGDVTIIIIIIIIMIIAGTI